MVIEASDGQELIDQYSALRAQGFAEPAVVVSDVGMPGCDGISATQVLRSSSLRPEIALVRAFERRADFAPRSQHGLLELTGSLETGRQRVTGERRSQHHAVEQ